MLFLAALTLATAAIDESTLLYEYGSFAHLLQAPNPTYVMKQDSSYDRASKEPGNDAWFANGDAGQFIRVETNEGRSERVMMECDQPGAVMRIWSANPAGTLRFYFDGVTSPQWTVPAQELLSGKVKGLGEPFAYVASRGWNIYYPIAFAKSLKITAEGDGSQNMYYHVGYRKYRPGVAVKTFDPNGLAVLAANKAVKALAPLSAARPNKTFTLLGGEAKSIYGAGGAGTVKSITVRVNHKAGEAPGLAWADPHRMHNVLRKMKLDIWTDGEHCVEVPLSDFFGSGVGVNPLNSVPMTVTKDGYMTCRFPMPYNRAIDITVVNGNNFSTDVEFLVQADKLKGLLQRNLFKAQYLAYKGDSQPKRDMEMLHAEGEGWLVGSTLTIENTRPDWWGEGDEKIFVDGEKFPSFFGTGTEDFYGYAWCWPHIFDRPFHAQPRVDGPGNFGHTTVNRWFIADAIPFKKSLKFDLELWHWAACDVKFSRVSYWYAKPGGSKIAEFDGSLLTPAELVPNPPIKGAIEGESLKVLSRSGGDLENQEGFFELSMGKQLWWTHMKEGDTLKLSIPVEKPGRYELVGVFCKAKDYGIHELSFAGQTKVLDFFNPTVTWEKISLGDVETTGTSLEMTVTSKGHRAGAVDGNMFGLDYFLIVKK